MKLIKIVVVIALISGLMACSNDSTGPGGNDTDLKLRTSSFNVSGDIEADHDGVAWYVGLRSDNGNFINLSLSVSDSDIDEDGNDDFNLSLRFIGNEGPFELTAREYPIGSDGNVTVFSSYSNSTFSDETVVYSASPDASGSIRILSVSDTSIEASFSFTIQAGANTEGESVTITGEMNSECLTAETSFGC